MKLTTAEGERLEYSVLVRWEVASGDAEGARPPACSTQWAGTHPILVDGRTLVLAYREQVAFGGLEPRGVEIYALVSGRYAP